jgi:tetratricopeptide (TPR) repeat protein
MAAAAAENGNFEEAAQWQERVALSNELPANLRRGNEQRLALYKSGKPYRRSVASPQRTVVLDSVQQADEAIKNGNYDRAIAVLSQAIAADDKDPVPYYGRGFAYYKQQQYESAIADFNRAIELNPKDVDSYFYRARSFENTRHYQKARDDLLKTYALDPEHIGGMHNNLAWFFATCPDHSIRDGGKASEYIDRGLELHPNFGPAWDTCAAVFAEIDDFDDAIDWEKAYLGRNDITDESRRAAEKRLDLYEHHQPFRNQPEADQPVSPSTTASPPEK